MILIKPNIEILTPINREEILKRIEIAGRVCYKSENKITEDSALKFVRMLVQRGHEAMIEHVSLTVKFICDRGVTHEIVRHRMASYAQESTRYCNYGKTGDCTFIIPPWVNISPGKYTIDDIPPYLDNTSYIWFSTMWRTETAYLDSLSSGCTPQQARAVLPNSLKTELIMTTNIRELRHFLKLRTAKEAHPQMREVAIMLYDKLVMELPELFDDIVPYRG